MSLARRNGRSRTAIAAVQEPVRVAVYCRKSTDENLDSAFNSLDAQREACLAYITSQKHEGWVPHQNTFEDAAYSGGTLDRPALKRLLKAVEAGEVQCVAVYRADRLSRRLLDFLQLVEYFDKHGCAFVSITEQFNTSTPGGRLYQHMLLSFAEYERALIGERTRHKVHAARRKGRWTGGTPILGFDTAPAGGKLVVNGDEADQVRAIFEMYVANPSYVAVAQELNHRGWRRKTWTTRGGTHRQGKPWDRVNLKHLLANPLYAGLQRLGDDTFPGEHTAIVPRALFQRVQRLLAENHRSPTVAANKGGALLRGLVTCGSCGTAMAHQWTRKGSRVYRYYTCNRARREGWEVCPTKNVSADTIETFVVNEIKRIGTDPTLQRATFEQAVAQVGAQTRGLKAEGKRLEREVAAARAEIEGLTAAIGKAGARAEQALLTSLEGAHERVTGLESRLAEVRSQEAILAAQHVNEPDVTRALEAFDPIWDVLLAPERERVLRLLVERVTYDGASQKLEITFSPAGIATLAAEVGGEAS